MDNCKHHWVYSGSIYASMPAQRDRICSMCGLKDRITLDGTSGTEEQESYTGVEERFAKLLPKPPVEIVRTLHNGGVEWIERSLFDELLEKYYALVLEGER